MVTQRHRQATSSLLAAGVLVLLAAPAQAGSLAPRLPVPGVVAPVVGSVVAPVAPVLAPVVSAAAPVLAPVSPVLAPVVTPLASAAAPVLDPVLTPVAPVVAPVVSAAAPVLAPAAPVLAPLLPALPGAVPPLLSPLVPATPARPGTPSLPGTPATGIDIASPGAAVVDPSVAGPIAPVTLFPTAASSPVTTTAALTGSGATSLAGSLMAMGPTLPVQLAGNEAPEVFAAADAAGSPVALPVPVPAGDQVPLLLVVAIALLLSAVGGMDAVQMRLRRRR